MPKPVCMTQLKALPAPKPRISSKLRKAIDLRIRQGLSINKACLEAGISQSGYHKAMKRPAVQDHYQKTQLNYVREVEELKTLGKARAIEVAIYLMLNAKSETVRARMAEFLAGDGKTPTVAVHVDARQIGGAGYEYVRPGQNVVEIVDGVGPTDDTELD